MTNTIPDPSLCARCQDPIKPALRKVFFDEPYPCCPFHAMDRLPEGSSIVAVHRVLKPIMDRHGNVFDHEAEPRLDQAVVWDGKTFGNDGYCGPCHVAMEAEAGLHDAEREPFDIENANRRGLWAFAPPIWRLAALVLSRKFRHWYAEQRRSGRIAPWWKQKSQRKNVMESAE